MSIVIKSNNKYTGGKALPPMQQALTSEGEVYSKYLARVAADGGTVVSTDKIQRAIKFIFDNSLYGKIAVSASPYFAYKLDSLGGVEKLYSIAGDDLVGVKLNGGELPKIVDNFVSFNDGLSSDNTGGILSTSYKEWSEDGNITILAAMKGFLNTVSKPTYGLSTHDAGGSTKDIMSLYTSIDRSGAGNLIISDPFYDSDTTKTKAIEQLFKNKNGVVTSFYDLPALKFGIKANGLDFGAPTDVSPMPEIYQKKHYIDFGGMWAGTEKNVSGVSMSAMWVGVGLTNTQKNSLSLFGLSYL